MKSAIGFAAAFAVAAAFFGLPTSVWAANESGAAAVATGSDDANDGGDAGDEDSGAAPPSAPSASTDDAGLGKSSSHVVAGTHVGDAIAADQIDGGGGCHASAGAGPSPAFALAGLVGMIAALAFASRRDRRRDRRRLQHQTAHKTADKAAKGHPKLADTR